MGYSSKYNKSEANDFINELDTLISKLDTLGYSNSNLMGFIDHINSSNQSDFNPNASIWHGNSARAFAGKVETYLKNVKKLRVLANDYRNAAYNMVGYEDTLSEWKDNKPGGTYDAAAIGTGALIGGKAGTALGTVLPGVGNIVGGFTGGAIGATVAEGLALVERIDAKDNYKKTLDSKVDRIEEIIDQSTMDEVSSYIGYIKYNQYCFSINDLKLENSDFKKEAENFSDLGINCYPSDENIKIMVDNLREKISRINGYIRDLSIAFDLSVSKFQDYSDYLKGKKGDGGRGIYNINVPSLISCKFKEATQYFRTDKNASNPYQNKKPEKEKIRIELHPGDRGTINKKYIDFYKITDNAYGALQAEAGEGSWIPYENMRPEWWGVYTNDELEYEVRDDGTIWFIDTNSKGQKVYMGFTTVGVLTTCLETQANEGDSPTVYTNEDDSDSSTSHTDEKESDSSTSNIDENDTDSKDDNSNKEAEEASETDLENKMPDSENNSETNQELNINIDNSNEFSIDIPGDLGQYYTVTGYGKDGIWYSDGSTSFWASGTYQRQVFDIWKDAGGTYKNGIAVLNINGEDNYLVAVTETFGKAGDQITVSLDNGQKINCIIADIKSSSDSTWSQYGHLSEDGSYLNVLEFEVNMDKYLELNSNPSTDSWGLEWDSNSPVVNIVNNGSII